MLKKEFIDELSRRLDNYVSNEEKQNILDYYNELIEDTIERTNKSEEEVVLGLGPIDDIVKKVIPEQKKIHYEEVEVVENEKTDKKETTSKENNKNTDKTIIMIVIAVLTFPFWLGLLCAAAGCVIGFGVGGVGIGIGGIAAIIFGLTYFASNLAHTLFAIGIGITLIGISLIFTPLFVRLASYILKKLIQLIQWIANRIKKEVC